MKDDPTRSTAHGFWRFAANYLLAAQLVEGKIHAEGHLYLPTFQLHGLAIELSLKAFLLKRGRSLQDLRKLSHSLTAALDLARRHKLGRAVKLRRQELDAIRVLDITYSSSQLRYIVTGAIRLPHLIEVSRASKRLVVDLELLCTGSRGRIAHAV